MESISGSSIPTLDVEFNFDHQSSIDEHLTKSERKSIKLDKLQKLSKNKKLSQSSKNAMRIVAIMQDFSELMQTAVEKSTKANVKENIQFILTQTEDQQSKILALQKTAAKGLTKAKHLLKIAKDNVQDQNERLAKVTNGSFRKHKPWKIVAKDARLDDHFSNGKVKRQQKLAAKAQRSINDAQIGLEKAKNQASSAKEKVKIAAATCRSITGALAVAKQIKSLALDAQESSG